MRALVCWLALLLTVSATTAETVFTAAGELDAKSATLKSGEAMAEHVFTVKAGMFYAVSLNGRQFKPYVIAKVPGVEQQLEDAAAGRAARLGFVAPESGEARLVVTTTKPGEYGKYDLVAESGGLRAALTTDDAKLDGGEYHHTIPVWLPPAGTWTVTLGSREFNPYLVAKLGERAQEVDDSLGLGSTAAVLLKTTKSGIATLLLTSQKASEKGSYALEFSDGVKGLEKGLSQRGTLAVGDAMLQSGEFCDVLSFIGLAGKQYTLTAKGRTFDSYLIVTGPDGVKIEGDNTAAGRDAVVVLQCREDGLVQVVVTSAKPGEKGLYDLSVVVEPLVEVRHTT